MPGTRPASAPTGSSDLFGPFRRPAPRGWGIDYIEVCGCEDRVRLVRTMSAEDLEHVVANGWAIQRTVLRAAEARLRRLRRAKSPNAQVSHGAEDVK